jgi:hypothetical protein
LPPPYHVCLRANSASLVRTHVVIFRVYRIIQDKFLLGKNLNLIPSFSHVKKYSWALEIRTWTYNLVGFWEHPADHNTQPKMKLANHNICDTDQ